MKPEPGRLVALLAVVTPLVVLALAARPDAADGPAGAADRWAVGNGTDADAGLIDLTQATRTTVADMRLWPVPRSLPAGSRVQPYETTLLVVDAILVKYTRDESGDHLLLADPFGNTIAAAIPGADGLATSSFHEAIAAARARFEAVLPARSTAIPVRVTGIGFFSSRHGLTAAAPNGIEIHPVLDIVFNGNSQPMPTSALSLRFLPPELGARGLTGVARGARSGSGAGAPASTPTATPAPTATPTATATPTPTSTPTPTYTPHTPPGY